MNLFDQAVLLATGLVALYAIWLLIGQQKDEATKHIANYYYMVSFAVLFVSGVLLIFLDLLFNLIIILFKSISALPT